MKEIKNIKCFLLDMDGTIYLDNHLIDGALDFLQNLELNQKQYIFLTNNSSENKKAYQEKLANLGLIIDEDQVFTSGEATSWYIKNLKKDAKVFLLGTPFLEEEFNKAGFTLVKSRDDKPDFFVLGFDTTLTYEKILVACDFIREGVPFIATHPDLTCPLSNGQSMPDAGAMISMFEAATGKRPQIIGKPNVFNIEVITKKYGLQKDEIAMVGDRLYTDIKMGVDAGITTFLVLTGETTLQMYEDSTIQADYVLGSVKDLGKLIVNY
ncbi:HAD family hydrolase [Anaerobacillus alkalilacustris]|uniref:Acid sugar phosphatase n=1 Tax=Anaerobacillus alkalilacustris TaxID=393763 RepID=A0A1S2LK49_9BACI|nr:HAD-IIA family hydrolase [Anaerobacillus alkalilacustris]OIJ12570.1 HAD family hydrolase [Anaerobacillus alkalilacustris]